MIGFTGAPFDRVDHLRDDANMARLRADPAARLLRLDGLDPVTDADGALGWTPLDGTEGPLALLGLDEGAPRFVALSGVAGGARRSVPLMRLLDHWPAEVAATWAIARDLVDWHARHGFCANCGAGTAPIRAGWARRCPSCRAEHFPRTDPVVIMLAEHDGRVLVGRQAAWPAGRYSALAGFVEVGESIEEAVRRELMEEAGLRAGAVRYVASQPWPFPSQLMIGCVAQAIDDVLTVDGTELEAAMWVGRDAVRAALAGNPAAPFLPPPPYAIAHSLMAAWVDA